MRLRINDHQFMDTAQGIDISIPLSSNPDSVRAWYCESVKIEPVISGDFVGDVLKGGSVNFRNIFLNPHGNGTHTECVGHISRENFTINQCLKEFHFMAKLISVAPVRLEKQESVDWVINRETLERADTTASSSPADLKAILIRTLPNEEAKKNRNYSNTNPPYLTVDAIEWILEQGFEHLVLDLPSVDREVDGGILAGHHRFWEYPENTQTNRTITEMAYFPDSVTDGIYVLNIQITSLESDASPSKLVLYEIFEQGIR